MSNLFDMEVAVGLALALALVALLAVVVQRRVPVAATAAGPVLAAALAALPDGSDNAIVGAFRKELNAVKDAQAGMAGQLREHDHHLAQVRTMLGALPSKDAVHKLEIEVSDLKGEVKAITATTSSTGRTVERIEAFLLSKSTL